MRTFVRAALPLAVLCLAVPCPPCLRAQTTLQSHSGAVFGEFLGESVAGAGDLNGDGFDDVIAGSSVGEIARVYSGANGAVLHLKTKLATFDDFGAAVAGVGDVDLDGFPDFAVGAPQFLAAKPGFARVYSGVTGAVLLHLAGAFGTGDDFGSAVCGPGDVNGDGRADVAVGAHQPGNFVSGTPEKPGYVRIFSGAGGALLVHAAGHHIGDWFGRALAPAGDFDRDGTPDLLVGAPQNNVGTGQVGRAVVLSGVDGATLATLSGDAPTDRFGFSVAFAGDVDSDGHGDLVVGAPQFTGGGRGYARVYAGLTGGTVHALACELMAKEFGHSVASAGDLDGDGRPETIVGSPDCGTCAGNGSAHVYSGSGGALLFSLEGLGLQDRFGAAVAGAGDVDGDGVPDLLVGAPSADGPGFDAGKLRVASGASLTLVANAHVIDASAGGVQSFEFSAGPKHVGQIYLCLGSLSGSAPGARIDGWTLPLNVDAYTWFTLGGPGQLIAGGIGALDSAGKASASLGLAPGQLAGLVPIGAHHAFVALGPSGVTLASNAVVLTLLP